MSLYFDALSLEGDRCLLDKFYNILYLSNAKLAPLEASTMHTLSSLLCMCVSKGNSSEDFYSSQVPELKPRVN